MIVKGVQAISRCVADAAHAGAAPRRYAAFASVPPPTLSDSPHGTRRWGLPRPRLTGSRARIGGEPLRNRRQRRESRTPNPRAHGFVQRKRC